MTRIETKIGFDPRHLRLSAVNILGHLQCYLPLLHAIDRPDQHQDIK
jgi:hypothetical protein